MRRNRGPLGELMTVRKATSDDALSIAKVVIGGWQATYPGVLDEDYLAELSVDVRAERERAYLDDIAAGNRDMAMFVAEDGDGKVVGFLRGQMFAYETREPEGDLSAIHVEGSHQGQGIGAALTSKFITWLLAIGVRRMSTWAFEGNTKGRAFYSRLGGRLLPEKRAFDIGGQEVEAVAYAWDDVEKLRSLVEKGRAGRGCRDG